MGQEARQQHLHTLVADEARKIAESIVGLAASLVEQMEPDRRDVEAPRPDSPSVSASTEDDAAPEAEPQPRLATRAAPQATPAPPPHWLQRVATQPPAHWVERVRQHAPDRLTSLQLADTPAALSPPKASAAPTPPEAELTTRVADASQVEAALATWDWPGSRPGETPSLSPGLDAEPVSWPALLPETPASVPERQDAAWRAWEHDQKLKREQQGRRWNA